MYQHSGDTLQLKVCSLEDGLSEEESAPPIAQIKTKLYIIKGVQYVVTTDR